jgi:hypothetical protein
MITSCQPKEAWARCPTSQKTDPYSDTTCVDTDRLYEPSSLTVLCHITQQLKGEPKLCTTQSAARQSNHLICPPTTSGGAGTQEGQHMVAPRQQTPSRSAEELLCHPRARMRAVQQTQHRSARRAQPDHGHKTDTPLQQCSNCSAYPPCGPANSTQVGPARTARPRAQDRRAFTAVQQRQRAHLYGGCARRPGKRTDHE